MSFGNATNTPADPVPTDVPPARGSCAWKARVSLPPDRLSPRTARRFLEVVARGWDLPWIADAHLPLTEVVSNVVVHAQTDMTISFEADKEHLRVEVSDCSATTPQPHTVTGSAENGRGLFLLDHFSSSWGWHESADPSRRKTVWFVLDRTADYGELDADSIIDITSIAPL